VCSGRFSLGRLPPRRLTRNQGLECSFGLLTQLNSLLQCSTQNCLLSSTFRCLRSQLHFKVFRRSIPKPWQHRQRSCQHCFIHFHGLLSRPILFWRSIYAMEYLWVFMPLRGKSTFLQLGKNVESSTSQELEKKCTLYNWAHLAIKLTQTRRSVWDVLCLIPIYTRIVE